MNINTSFERDRIMRKSLGKRPDTVQIADQNFEKVKRKLLDDIKSEIE